MPLARQLFVGITKAAAASAGVALFAMVVLFVFNAAVFSAGPERVQDALARSIADGSVLETSHHGPVGWLAFRRDIATPIYAHDCLLWASLIASVPDLITRTIRTPRLVPAERAVDFRVPKNPDCQAVGQALAAAAPEAMPRIIWYDRYILGQRALSHLLLTNFSVSSSATIVKATVYSIFGLVLLLAWQKGALAISVIAAMFLLFYGLAHFGSMLYFAPIDVVHALVLLIATYRPFGTAPASQLVVVGATYGSLVAIFEVLTGGIPLGLVLASILTGLSAPDTRSFFYRALLLMASFAVAVFACFAIKLAIVSFHVGTNAFAENFGPLVHRMRGDFIPESGNETNARTAAGLHLLLTGYGYWSLLIGWGSPIFGIILVVTGASSLVIATALAVSRKDDAVFPPALSGCWLAIGVAIAWVLVFWNHSLLHPFFMARLLIIPLLCGGVAVTESLRMRRAPMPIH